MARPLAVVGVFTARWLKGAGFAPGAPGPPAGREPQCPPGADDRGAEQLLTGSMAQPVGAGSHGAWAGNLPFAGVGVFAGELQQQEVRRVRDGKRKLPRPPSVTL